MNSTILFLCPHGAAKSIMAAADLNRLAGQYRLALVGMAAGTEPDEVVSPAVVELLRGENIDVSDQRPHRVTHDEIEQAARVISMGCAIADLEIDPEHVEEWLDVPSPSQNLTGAREAIRAHVKELVAGFKDQIVS